MISALIGTLIGMTALIGWLTGEGSWTWVNYVVLGSGIWIGIGAVWMSFKNRW